MKAVECIDYSNIYLTLLETDFYLCGYEMGLRVVPNRPKMDRPDHLQMGLERDRLRM